MCRRRILIVDDESDIRNILRRLLLSEGYCVCEAGNGLEALSAAQHCDVDLILIDITMPRMNGTEAVRQLRANPRFADTPVMFMTGNALNVPANTSGQVGEMLFFPKPLNLQLVLNAIQRVVQPVSRPGSC